MSQYILNTKTLLHLYTFLCSTKCKIYHHLKQFDLRRDERVVDILYSLLTHIPHPYWFTNVG